MSGAGLPRPLEHDRASQGRQGARPLRVLVVANRYPTDRRATHAGAFIAEQVEAMARLGHSVTVVVPEARGAGLVRGFRHGPGRVRSVEVRFARFAALPWMFFGDGGRWTAAAAQACLREVAGERFDLVHAHNAWPAGAVAGALSKALRVPYVVTEHRHAVHPGVLSGADRKRIAALRGAAAVAAVNPEHADAYRKAGAAAVFVPNGFDLAKLRRIPRGEARRRLGLDGPGPFVFSLGALVPKKAHELAIRALPSVLAAHPGALLLIGGEGPRRAFLQREATRLGLGQSVRLLGRLADDELPAWYSAADVFCLPSASESFGVVQLEALACGTPVVSTPTPGGRLVLGGFPERGTLAAGFGATEIAAALLEQLRSFRSRTEADAERLAASVRSLSWDDVALRIERLWLAAVS